MVSSVRYSAVEGVDLSVRANAAPVAIVEPEVVFDRFIHSNIIRFRLQNNLDQIIDSAVVALRFYRHYKHRRYLVASKEQLIIAYYGLKIRPGDFFGNNTEISFPQGGADEVEIAVTRIFVCEYDDDSAEQKRVVFADTTGFERRTVQPGRYRPVEAQPGEEDPLPPEPVYEQEDDEEEESSRVMRLAVPLLLALVVLAGVLLYVLIRLE